MTGAAQRSGSSAIGEGVARVQIFKGKWLRCQQIRDSICLALENTDARTAVSEGRLQIEEACGAIQASVNTPVGRSGLLRGLDVLWGK